MTGPVVFSFILSGRERGAPVPPEEFARAVASGALVWAHLDALHPEARDWVAAHASHLDRQTLDALFAEETRPRASQVGDGLLVFLRGVNLNEGAEPEDMVSIRVWAEERLVITLRRRLVRAARDIEDRVREMRGPETAGQFVALLVDRLTGRIEPRLGALEEQADDLEEAVVEHASPELRRPVTDIRRAAIRFRRYIAPQRDAISEMRITALPWIADPDRRRLSENQDRLQRMVEELDAIRERAQIVKDELANALADRLNRNMYILSVIAAIFLPLGFLTGLFGINLGGMPGAGSPAAFWIFSALLVVVVVLQVWFFKRRKWF